MADKFKAGTMKELAIALSKKQEHEVECLTGCGLNRQRTSYGTLRR